MTPRLKSNMLLLVVVLALAAVDQAAATTVADPSYKVVCYFEGWTSYRTGNGKHDVEDINPQICTHLIYAFAGLNTNHEIYSLDPWHDLEPEEGGGLSAFKRFTGLKSANPALKTMISIGGWNEGSKNYSDMAATAENRAIFVTSVVDFLTKYNFDGLDVDWEYPGQRDGLPEDKDNLVLLMQELSAALKPHGLLLTIAVCAGKQTIDSSYVLGDMVGYVDWMNVMNFDYHGNWDKFVDHHAPLYVSQLDNEHQYPYVWYNINFTINYIIEQGVSPSMLVMGIPMYGRGFKLADDTEHEPYDGSVGAMEACEYSKEDGFCGYNELCELVFSQGGWTDVHDTDMKVIYSYKGSDWIGWDDLWSVQNKLDYVKSMNMGGAMLWSLDSDDFRGLCGDKRPINNLVWNQLNG